MRTKEEIKIEIARLEEELKGVVYDDPLWDKLNSRLWALKWVLKEER